jgi:hypothetical protein
MSVAVRKALGKRTEPLTASGVLVAAVFTERLTRRLQESP